MAVLPGFKCFYSSCSIFSLAIVGLCCFGGYSASTWFRFNFCEMSSEDLTIFGVLGIIWPWVKKMPPLGTRGSCFCFSFSQTGIFRVPGIFDPWRHMVQKMVRFSWSCLGP